MTYKETLDYLYKQLPMFHRIGPAAYKADLNNTIAICEALGHPEEMFRSIHIAGTNGKGSTSHMLASVLMEAGYKVGLYTSPHLKDFRERITINGKMIPKPRVVRFVENHRQLFEKIQPSFFEWTVGLAFDYFAEEEVDIAVIETGLGGRLDSTNVITPLVSVITNISYDHMNLLGNTLRKIAAEKAGIIKPGVPVVIGETQPEVKTVFTKAAKAAGSMITFADQVSKVEKPQIKNGMLHAKLRTQQFVDPIVCGLPGFYQAKNIGTVVVTSALLAQIIGFPIDDKAVWRGIKNVVANTGLKGRWQTIAKTPLTIADTGHNEAGIREVVRMIKATPHRKLHFVLGVVNDKHPGKVLSLLPKNAAYYFCKAKLPRAMEARALQEEAMKHKVRGNTYASVKSAVKAARAAAGKNDLVFVGGSTFVVAEAI